MESHLDDIKEDLHSESDEYDSEVELPLSKRSNKQSADSGLLGANLSNKHPIYGDEKEVTYSSSRRKRKQNRARGNLIAMNELREINHLKKPSEETKGTTNTTNNPSKNKSNIPA